MEKQKVLYQDLADISYSHAWNYQTELMKELIQNKLKKRSLSEDELKSYKQIHHLLFCEHNHVYTLGKSGSRDNLLLNEEGLKHQELEFFKINRGGDITYHGPGQITGYPIFDLDEFFTDVHKYVRFIEEVIIRCLECYGISGSRLKGYTGVWIMDPESSQPFRKICAIGVHLSRWVTMHGFAFNVNTDLEYFNNIIPCGIAEKDKSVTSLEKELGKKVPIEEVKLRLKTIFAQLFEFEYLSQ
jgi:lipoyl(octanoyl) transferase